MARQQPATQFKKTLTQGNTAPETRVFGKVFVMNAAEKCKDWDPGCCNHIYCAPRHPKF
jgi:hypothetical protein